MYRKLSGTFILSHVQVYRYVTDTYRYLNISVGQIWIKQQF